MTGPIVLRWTIGTTNEAKRTAAGLRRLRHTVTTGLSWDTRDQAASQCGGMVRQPIQTDSPLLPNDVNAQSFTLFLSVAEQVFSGQWFWYTPSWPVTVTVQVRNAQGTQAQASLSVNVSSNNSSC